MENENSPKPLKQLPRHATTNGEESAMEKVNFRVIFQAKTRETETNTANFSKPKAIWELIARSVSCTYEGTMDW